MKKFLKSFIFALVGLFSVVTLVACGHQHSFSEEYAMDSSQHWHECECGEMKDVATHEYGEWVETPATETADGLKKKTCKQCGFEMKEVLPMIQAIEYYIRGGMNGWNPVDEGKLVISDDKATATITITIEAGVEFKIANSDWSKEFNYSAPCFEGNENFEGNNGNIKCKVAGSYTFTVTGLYGSGVLTVEKN